MVYCLEGVPVHYVFEGFFVTDSLQDRPRYLLLKVRGLVLREGSSLRLSDLRALASSFQILF